MFGVDSSHKRLLFTWKLVFALNNCVVPIPNPLLILFHIKFGLCNSGFDPFSINIWLLFNVVELVPPKETGKVSDATQGHGGQSAVSCRALLLQML